MPSPQGTKSGLPDHNAVQGSPAALSLRRFHPCRVSKWARPTAFSIRCRAPQRLSFHATATYDSAANGASLLPDGSCSRRGETPSSPHQRPKGTSQRVSATLVQSHAPSGARAGRDETQHGRASRPHDWLPAGKRSERLSRRDHPKGTRSPRLRDPANRKTGSDPESRDRPHHGPVARSANASRASPSE